MLNVNKELLLLLPGNTVRCPPTAQSIGLRDKAEIIFNE